MDKFFYWVNTAPCLHIAYVHRQSGVHSAWSAEPEIATVWPSVEKRWPALDLEGQQAMDVGENVEWGWAGMKTSDQVEWSVWRGHEGF